VPSRRAAGCFSIESFLLERGMWRGAFARRGP
jgi:hypothetical protein